MKIQHSNASKFMPKYSYNGHMSSNTVFLRSCFLRDYPQFATLFKTLNMPDDLPLLVSQAEAERRICARFEATFSVHNPGTIGDAFSEDLSRAQVVALNAMSAHMLFPMSPSHGFQVAVQTASPWGEVDLGSVLRMYGFYVAARASHATARNKFSENDAVAAALAVPYALNCAPFFGERAGDSADTLVAWMNAVWICWMVGIDPRVVVVGLLLDCIPTMQNDWRALLTLLKALTPVVVSRAEAERLFNASGRKMLNHATRLDTQDRALCAQINKATIKWLDQIVAESRRQVKHFAEV